MRFGCFTFRVSHVSPDSGTCRGLWFGAFVWLFVASFSPCLVLFCKCQIRFDYSFFSDAVLDDRQCFAIKKTRFEGDVERACDPVKCLLV